MAALFDSPDSQLWFDESRSVIGGFVNNAEPHLLPPNQAARLLNILPTVDGRREKRLGVHPIGTGIDDENPNALHEFYVPSLGIDHLVGQWGTGIYSSPGDDVWTRQASGCSFCDTPHMGVQGRGVSGLANLFLASCVGVTDNASLPYGYLVHLTTGWAASPATDVRPRALAWFQGRLWAYNSCQTNHGLTWLGWSAPLDGSDFSAADTYGFHAVPDSADVGSCIIPARDGTPRIFLFNERSIYQLDIYWKTDGYYPANANELDFTKSLLRPIVLSTGCIAPRGAIWVPGQNAADLLFLSREGIRFLSRSATDAQSGTPLPLSYRIQKTIDRINWAHAARSCAAFWDGYAYFAVPVDGAVNPNFIIAYDVHRDGFLELDFDVRAWAEARLGSNRRFFFMSGTAGTETYPGAATGVTHGYHVYEWASGQADPFGLPITFTEETKAFSFDQGGQPGDGIRVKKKPNYFDFAIQSGDTGCTLAIDYKLDDDYTWRNLGYIYIDPDTAAPYLPVQLPFGFGSGKIVKKTLLARQLAPFYRVQLRLNESSYARIKVVSIALAANPLNPKFHR